MKPEDLLRTEGGRALEEAPTEGAYARFEPRARRRTVARRTGAALALAAVVTATAVILPRVAGRPVERGFVQPGDGAGDRETPPPPTTKPYADPIAVFKLEYPEEWLEWSAQLGAYVEVVPPEFAPPPDPPEPVGGLADEGPPPSPARPGFIVRITYEDESRDTFVRPFAAHYESHERAGADITSAEVKVGGAQAISYGGVYPDEETGLDGWCPGCHVADYFITWKDDSTLRVHVVALNADAFETYGADGLQIVDSIEPFAWPGAAVEPQRGTVGEGIPIDDLTQALVRFMDARFEDTGAEHWLSRNASDQYERNEKGMHLYDTSNPYFARYEIRSREDVDASSAEFVVWILEKHYSDPDYRSTFYEVIGVGPGANVDGEELPAVIRFAMISQDEGAPQP